MNAQQSLDLVRVDGGAGCWPLGLDIIHERAVSVSATTHIGQGTMTAVTWQASCDAEAPETLHRSAPHEERTGQWAGMIQSE